MTRLRRSSKIWFKHWDGIISLEDTLSRIKLSEVSGASVQTIKSLQKDWMMQNDIVYDNGVFSHYKIPNISISLAPYLPASEKDKERMK